MEKQTYTCIGKTRTRQGVVSCTNTSTTPTWKDQYLCSSCANGRAGRDETNVGAMQTDPEEYRDQVAAGFAAGASRFYDGEFDGSNE